MWAQRQEAADARLLLHPAHRRPRITPTMALLGIASIIGHRTALPRLALLAAGGGPSGVLPPQRRPRATATVPRAAPAGTGAPLGYEGPLEPLDEADYLMLHRAELMEGYRQSILRRRPRFLPFDECTKWVQAMGLWDNKEEWQEWIANGEKRNPYIPSRPDEYYGKLGQWQGWSFFLRRARDSADNAESSFDETQV
uniref:Uncharacterized protein n=1 Tax=Pyrodinium bahamense TaxID=73915 RepID=A0A7S0B905_9DINO|mmetsp:Transcript_54678/g.151697  ORF Transcript_54678/g.151697 Transcript_54678/m.151697 type:complete len:197 (+) Transcript_54678:140-730(+)|eukprot:CAMPEP_0179170370 /NCGR_PEP_ID=MMETSP0796-20121207/83923_1 /TAXON_ID=73915 /ORGANISM="Pyrodinium bahamense, Strain pbaha01" /LENGTH=196 /DNA_ID=CAMNT_0020873335 /DNA_START=117 /DNA_END=707 /DNA_ORIENTATION=-